MRMMVTSSARNPRRVAALLLSFYAVVLSGCASNPGVAPLGGDRYVVSRQAATGFTGIGSLQAEALREAEAYCDNRQRALQVIGTKESRPPYVLGNFPRSEVEFRCVAIDGAK
jgi:hypothetical protein